MGLTIAIDFDDTLTADPVLWGNFISDARSKGHRVLCVTARRSTEENHQEIQEFCDQWDIRHLPVIFSALGSKLSTMERRGIKVDVWIDDDPARLVNGH